MKKTLIIGLLLVMGLVFAGCDFFTTTTTSTKSTADATTTTTEAITTTTTTTTRITTTAIPIYAFLLPGQDTVELMDEWVDAGARVHMEDSDIEMITEDTVDTDTLGLYQIVYTLNFNGVDYNITRYVIVVDTTAPILTLNAGIDTVMINTAWTDAGVAVIENSGGDVTIATTGSVDTTTAGTYMITYIATDESGNSESITRYVTVIE